FNAHLDFFEEIAKYRAARRIWARWMRDRYGATVERSLQLRFHTQTAGVSLTAQQPEVNIARTAIEALAGVLGGTQSLHPHSTDGNDDDSIEILQITPEQEQQQIKRLQAVRADRDDEAVARALDRVRADAADPERNLVPTLIDAVQAYATEGEVMGALADVF